MASQQWDPINDYTQRDRVKVPSYVSLGIYGTEEVDALYDGDTEHLIDERQNTFHLQDIASAAAKSIIHKPSVPTLGKPIVKKRIYVLDILVIVISLLCFALAFVAVSNEKVSWRLGVQNNQLIVIGFLLSIMNLCLASISPTLFLLLEARFGSSTLQNYDAILRNKPFGSRLSILWRAALGLMLVLPIGLSVAYKAFTGGQSTLEVDSMDYIRNTTYYGMFSVPGLSSLSLGVSIFLNATLPFQVASSLRLNGSDPPLPTFPQPYGYNVLLLNQTSTAVLDILQPDYIVEVQKLLAIGESWTVTAPVIGTVATLSDSKTEDPTGFNSSFISACEGSGESPWKWSFTNDDMYTQWFLSLLDGKVLSDQSAQYIVISPAEVQATNLIPNEICSNFTPYVQLYNVYRQQCQGTWSITWAGIQLTNGFCTDTTLPSDKQQMITWNDLMLGSFYIPSLIETLAPFSGGGARGNQSSWMNPSMATSVAAMLWARIVTINIPKSFNSAEVDMSAYAWTTESNTNLTYRDIDLYYPINQTAQSIFYIRPTLQKSGKLYLVFAIQPLLIVIVLGLTGLFHSVPLSKGFGLVSILSGANRETLDILAGASLSGELTQPVKLTMLPMQSGERSQNSEIEYQTKVLSKAPDRNGKLVRNIKYY